MFRLLALAAGFFRCSILFLGNRPRLARLVWIAVLMAACVPFDFVAYTHWEKVGWIPFLTPPVKGRDIVANLLLYVPFGFLSAAGRPRAARTMLKTIAEAGVLSLVLEASQLFSHARFPSATDLVCNITGAVIGVAVFRLTGASDHLYEPLQSGAK